MKLLDRYLAKNVLSSIGLVTMMLAGLQVFILFVSQLPDLGKADYSLMAAITYVMLEMPYEVYLFFPMASLLGCLIGLGHMASHHELVVMRAAGMSILQVTMAVVKIAMLLIVCVTWMGESVLPGWVRLAHQQKAEALSGGQSLQTAQGFWVRYQNNFIKIGQIEPDHRLNQILQFQFDEKHRLILTRSIAQLTEKTSHTRAAQTSWIAHGVEETLIDEKHTSARHVDTMIWDVPLAWGVLGASQRQLDEMTLYELHQALHAQKKNHLIAKNEQLIYVQRLMQPFTTLVMMLLAIPFIFGPLRSSTMGSKLLTGAAVGFGFYIVNRFLGSASQVYQWSSMMAAIAPTFLCAGLGLWLMRKTV